MTKTIWLDMDGTFADLYGVENWLPMLIASDPTPYIVARPLVHMATLARLLNTAQRKGWNIGVISWTSKSGSADYNAEVTAAKLVWLAKHLPSVHFDEINIVPYGTPKQNFAKTSSDVLFDDEAQNRENWTGNAYNVQNLLKTLAFVTA